MNVQGDYGHLEMLVSANAIASVGEGDGCRVSTDVLSEIFLTTRGFVCASALGVMHVYVHHYSGKPELRLRGGKKRKRAKVSRSFLVRQHVYIIKMNNRTHQSYSTRPHTSRFLPLNNIRPSKRFLEVAGNAHPSYQHA